MYKGKKPSFSISYFGTYPAEYSPNKYDLLFKSAAFADANGFEALWIPERHFHPFGGFSPNPSVLAGALSRITKNVHLRAGSVVLPLHHPARIVEEWSVVDNCSEGRTGLAFASGWHPNDFILTNNKYENRKKDLFHQIQTVKELWEGKTLPFNDANGKKINVSVHPRPLQKTPPLWVAVLGNPESYAKAGELGIGILTNMIVQSTAQLAEGIKIYKESLKKHGHPEEAARVCVLLHTFIGNNKHDAIEAARRPLYNYLSSSMQLFQKTHADQENATQLDQLSEEDKNFVFGRAYQRYVDGHALIGTVESCLPTLKNLEHIGVTEFAAFIDFGVEHETVYNNLRFIAALKDQFNNTSSSFQTQPTPLNEYQSFSMTHDLNCNPQVRLKIKGVLNEELLIDCIKKVVMSHESLCTYFSQNGSAQHLENMPSMTIVRKDMGENSVENITHILEKARTTKFTPSSNKLFHVHLLKSGPKEFILSLTASLLICDADSLITILKDVTDKYSASLGEPINGFDMFLQLSDYISEKNNRYTEEQIHKNQLFWKKQFPQSSKARIKNVSGRTSSLKFEIPASLFHNCRKTAIKMKCTPFMLFMFAYSQHLQSTIDQDNLIILTPAGNRKLLGNTNLVGNISFNIPIPVLKEDSANSLHGFKHILSMVFEHYYATPQFFFECLQGSNDPIYVFEMNRYPVIDLKGLECTLTTAFPLHHNAISGLSLNEENGKINAQWTYDLAFDSQDTIRLKHENFIRTIEQIISGKDLIIS